MFIVSPAYELVYVMLKVLENNMAAKKPEILLNIIVAVHIKFVINPNVLNWKTIIPGSIYLGVPPLLLDIADKIPSWHAAIAPQRNL